MNPFNGVFWLLAKTHNCSPTLLLFPQNPMSKVSRYVLDAATLLKMTAGARFFLIISLKLLKRTTDVTKYEHNYSSLWDFNFMIFGEPIPLYSNINFSFSKNNSQKEREICQLVSGPALPRYFLGTGSQLEDSSALV